MDGIVKDGNIGTQRPSLKEEEVHILFSKGARYYGDYVKYPEKEYCYLGVFGRFKVINGKIYSAMYYLPEEINGIPCRRKAKMLLEGFGYEIVNGITIEDFLKLLKAVDKIGSNIELLKITNFYS